MSVYIRFECGHEDRFSKEFGPYEYAQVTYASFRVGEDGDTFLAEMDADGVWVTEDGKKWTDFVIYSKISGMQEG